MIKEKREKTAFVPPGSEVRREPPEVIQVNVKNAETAGSATGGNNVDGLTTVGSLDAILSGNCIGFSIAPSHSSPDLRCPSTMRIALVC